MALQVTHFSLWQLALIYKCQRGGCGGGDSKNRRTTEKLVFLKHLGRGWTVQKPFLPLPKAVCSRNAAQALEASLR